MIYIRIFHFNLILLFWFTFEKGRNIEQDQTHGWTDVYGEGHIPQPYKCVKQMWMFSTLKV